MKTSFPRVLETADGKLLNSGTAPEAGGCRYLKLSTGQITTAFRGTVSKSGQSCAWVSIHESPAMPLVKIAHRKISKTGTKPLSVGEEVILAFLLYGETTESHLGWRVSGPRTPRPVPKARQSSHSPLATRLTGVIVSIARTGIVVRDGAYRTYLADRAQVRGSRTPHKQMAVTFVPVVTGSLSAAMDVRAF